MGGKKRISDTEEEIEVEVETEANKDSPKPLKKKAKKDKKKVEEEKMEDGAATPSSSAPPATVMPMERKKKRKAMDKERRRTSAETEGVKPIQTSSDLKTDVETNASSSVASPSTSGALPEFHIGVFKDLASADESLREAAAKRLVMELQEVQDSYDRLENKELVEGGLKLEAEKDDGLDNCAPSVRYAIRRLIRGSSSAREVRVLLGT